jgi:predicted metal-binding protein
VDILVEFEKAKEIKEMALAFEDITEAKLIHTRNIVVDERVRFQCIYSGCRDYGRRLMCPPHTPSVAKFKKVLSGYYMALLVKLEGTVKNKENWEPETDQWALRLHDIIYKLEKKAFSLGFPFAAGLIGGSCKLCQECPGEKDSNAKCIQREKARPSMEAMGIDVLSTCKNAGIEVEFSPEKVIWSGMILLA